MSSDGFNIFSKEARLILENAAKIQEQLKEKFNDSVYIEANHLASKISEDDLKESFLLDETDPPELIDNTFNESDSKTQDTKEVIFKKLDLLIPPMPLCVKKIPLSKNSTDKNEDNKVADKSEEKKVADKNKLVMADFDNLVNDYMAILSKPTINKEEYLNGQSILKRLLNQLKMKYKEGTENDKNIYESTNSKENVMSNSNPSKINLPRTRGPMKATIPISDLGRNDMVIKNKIRGSRVDDSPLKRDQMRPVAQSTPESKYDFNNVRNNSSNSSSGLYSSRGSTIPRYGLLPRTKSFDDKESKPAKTRSSSYSETDGHITPIKPRSSSITRPKSSNGSLIDRSNSSPRLKPDLKSAMRFSNQRLMVPVKGKENRRFV